MNIFSKLLIILGLMTISLLSVSANTYYVSMTGSDTNSGSFFLPWRTVKHAWRNSGGGDTVLVRGGIYSENKIWLHTNSQGRGIENMFWTLKTYPGEVSTFEDSRFIVEDDYVRIQGLNLTGKSFLQSVSWGELHDHIEFLNNDISGSPKVPILFNANYGVVEGNNIHPVSAVHGIYVLHGDGNVIRNNHVVGVNKYGIHIYDENKYRRTARITNLLVENNTVIGSRSRSGIIICAGESKRKKIEINGVVIRNNIFINNAQDGISIKYFGRVHGVDILNNVILGNDVYGLCISAQNVTNISIKNNIFSFNKTHIDISGQIDDLIIHHNLYWNPSSVGQGVTDNHAIFLDPLFVNTDNVNFYLRDSSPAIDAGVDVGVPYNSYAPDLGAYEYGRTINNPSIK